MDKAVDNPNGKAVKKAKIAIIKNMHVNVKKAPKKGLDKNDNDPKQNSAGSLIKSAS